jgi:hypothetical protein
LLHDLSVARRDISGRRPDTRVDWTTEQGNRVAEESRTTTAFTRESDDRRGSSPFEPRLEVRHLMQAVSKPRQSLETRLTYGRGSEQRRI